MPANSLDAIERANRSEETTWRKKFQTESALAAHVEALNAFGSHRAVGILDVLQKECAVLLERVTPGERLASIATEGEALAIVTRLFAEGWPKPPERATATPLRTFAESLTRAAAVDREFIRPAALFENLLTTSAEHVLLHGDLHYDNILSSDRAGYLLIDPKGAIGDPAFDIGYLVSRPMPVARGTLPLTESVDRRLAFLPDVWAWIVIALRRLVRYRRAVGGVGARRQRSALEDFVRATRILEVRC